MPDPATSFDATAWRRRLRVAQGLEPADLVLAGGTIVDVSRVTRTTLTSPLRTA